jgi:hypothetical protein
VLGVGERGSHGSLLKPCLLLSRLTRVAGCRAVGDQRVGGLPCGPDWQHCVARAVWPEVAGVFWPARGPDQPRLQGRAPHLQGVCVLVLVLVCASVFQRATLFLVSLFFFFRSLSLTLSTQNGKKPVQEDDEEEMAIGDDDLF